MRIEFLKSVDSTNNYIQKYRGGGENVIVCAERQSAGRGTKGRTFLSDAGGVYLSALFYPDLEAGQAFRLMAHAAVSVCKTLEGFGAHPAIKWANDVFLGEKKCCGILIENFLKENKIYESVIGIGLNVKNDLSSLSDIACSLREVLKNCPTVEEVRGKLTENLTQKSTFEEYLSFVGFLGRRVQVLGKERYFATAKRVLLSGELEVEKDGELIKLSSGEISVRLT